MLESNGYPDLLRRFFRQRIVFNEAVEGNPTAEVVLTLSADGQVVTRTLVKPSGHAAWDAAVMRGLERTQRLPLDAEGKIPPTMTLVFRPRD
ncbi:MAG: TonB C-terminal domain-containing protein [Comamonadaceae bacterium]|nr:MAG: TonB C-terminal domain-containing protein [Comamonadaceae bacterium]